MLQRRTKGSSYSDLPITVNKGTSVTRLPRKTNRFNSNNDNNSNKSYMLSFGLFIGFIILLVILLRTGFDYVSHHPEADTMSSVNDTKLNRSSTRSNFADGELAKFPSLKYPLENANLVGLYFAASWCPDSAPVSNSIENLFSSEVSPLHHHVLPRPTSDTDMLEAKKDFALVYVPSDESEEEMMGYIRHNWIPVPFDSPDKSNIKRHYNVCAHKEMKALGITQRRSQIPSLIIIESETQSILTIDGTGDIAVYGDNVLDHWLHMQEIVKSLSEKYD